MWLTAFHSNLFLRFKLVLLINLQSGSGQKNPTFVYKDNSKLFTVRSFIVRMIKILVRIKGTQIERRKFPAHFVNVFFISKPCFKSHTFFLPYHSITVKAASGRWQNENSVWEKACDLARCDIGKLSDVFYKGHCFQIWISYGTDLIRCIRFTLPVRDI